MPPSSVHLLCLNEVYTVNSGLTNFIVLQRLHENLTFSLVQHFLSRLPRIRSRQYRFISSGKSVLPIKLSTAYPQEKSSQTTNHAYLTDSEYFTCLLKKHSCLYGIWHRVDIYRFVKRLASFCL